MMPFRILLLLLLALTPWLVTLVRLRWSRSVPAAVCGAFIASGAILLCFALLGATNMLRDLQQLGPDAIMVLAYVGIGFMIAAAACALLDRR
ncbi:hypothetical protein GBF35_43635 [Nonomuraea phyllanthi]|uniref:hypothetical protein n=1 Tax=Nonomuraea phyllanthi TaxID=2219224 RepID=UPI001293BDCB|nr:hypothetical protein [Nonomuraea phyllanthi]QFY12558.1 hypothetical protein GBF35_43635 [Nonomuraea phyllanthi]